MEGLFLYNELKTEPRLVKYWVCVQILGWGILCPAISILGHYHYMDALHANAIL